MCAIPGAHGLARSIYPNGLVQAGIGWAHSFLGWGDVWLVYVGLVFYYVFAKKKSALAESGIQGVDRGWTQHYASSA